MLVDDGEKTQHQADAQRMQQQVTRQSQRRPSPVVGPRAEALRQVRWVTLDVRERAALGFTMVVPLVELLEQAV